MSRKFLDVNQAPKYSLVPRIFQSFTDIRRISECNDGISPGTGLTSSGFLDDPDRSDSTASLLVISGQLLLESVLSGFVREVPDVDSAVLVKLRVRQTLAKAHSLPHPAPAR